MVVRRLADCTASDLGALQTFYSPQLAPPVERIWPPFTTIPAHASAIVVQRKSAGSERVSQRAKLFAASRCVSACISNLRRLSSILRNFGWLQVYSRRFFQIAWNRGRRCIVFMNTEGGPSHGLQGKKEVWQ